MYDTKLCEQYHRCGQIVISHVMYCLHNSCEKNLEMLLGLLANSNIL